MIFDEYVDDLYLQNNWLSVGKRDAGDRQQ